MSDTPTAPPPGWYDDGSGRQRWWDGGQWTVYAQSGAAPAGPVSPKSRLVAFLLSFFLGAFAVDRFYLGNIGLGVAKLLLGWLTLGIWHVIDWILIVAGGAHDGDGLPVTRWE